MSTAATIIAQGILKGQIEALETAISFVDTVLKTASKYKADTCPLSVVEDLKESLQHLILELKKSMPVDKKEMN